MSISYPVVPVGASKFMTIINCLAVRKLISFPTLDISNVTTDMTVSFAEHIGHHLKMQNNIAAAQMKL